MRIAVIEERVKRQQAEVEASLLRIENKIDKIFNWLDKLPCETTTLRIENLEKNERNKFIIKSVRFLWGVIVILWGAILWIISKMFTT